MLVGVAAHVSPARAVDVAQTPQGPVQIEVRDTLRYEDFFRYSDPAATSVRPTRMAYFFNVLRVVARWDKLQLGAQISTLAFIDHREIVRVSANGQTTNLGRSTRNDPFRPEKLFLRWIDDHWEAEAGDNYITVGRGLLIAARKDNDTNRDLTLRGVRLRRHDDHVDAVFASGFTNPLNLDPIAYRFQSDPNDLVNVAHVQWRINDVVSVSAGGGYTYFGPLKSASERRFLQNMHTAMYGGGLELRDPGGRARFEAEGYGMFRIEREPDIERDSTTFKTNRQRGYGVYAAGELFFDWFSLLIDSKVYRNFQFGREQFAINLSTVDENGVPRRAPLPSDIQYVQDIWYNQAPTLLPIDEEFFNNADAYGVRVQPRFSIREWGTLITPEGIYIRNAGDGRLNDPMRVDEWHAGLDVAQNFAGGRVRAFAIMWQSLDRFNNHARLVEIIRWGLDAKIGLPRRFGIESQVRWRERQLGRAPPRHEFDASLGVGLPGNVIVSALFSYISQRTTRTVVDPRTGEETDQSYFDFDPFYAGAVNWRPDWLPLEVALFAGQLRGGFRCFGGVCRQYPTFYGVRSEIRVLF